MYEYSPLFVNQYGSFCGSGRRGLKDIGFPTIMELFDVIVLFKAISNCADLLDLLFLKYR